MKTGISTASLFLRKNNEEALPLFDAMGVRTAEVFLTSFSEYDAAFGKILAAKKGCVDVHSVHVLNTQFEPQLFADHSRVKEDAFAWLQKAMETARETGAKFYTFHGIARLKRASRSGENDNFEKWAQYFAKIADFCAPYGITPCLENVEWAIYNRPGVFAGLKKFYPPLCGVLDIKQARLSGYPYPMYLREMEGSLKHVHVSDTDENGRICLPGRGVFDFSDFLKRLRDAGFTGPLLIEVYKDDFQHEEELKRACDYLDELLYRYSFAD